MKKFNFQKLFWAIISLSCLGIIWHLASGLESMHGLLPSPIVVFRLLFKSFVEPIGKLTIPSHILWSLSRVAVGYGLAAVLGIVLGIAMAWSKVGQSIIKPFYLLLRPIPSIAWIPLAILWLGIDEKSKYFIIFIGTLLIIMTNTADGVRSIDERLLGAARMLGCSEKQLFTKIVLPNAVPQIFAGLQVGLGAAWATMIAAEMVRSSEGVGWIIIMGQNSVNMVQIFAGIIVIGIVGLILVTMMRELERKLCAWNIRGK